MKWLSRLTQGLSKTTAQAAHSLKRWLGVAVLDATTLQALEDALLQADCGPAATAHLLQVVQKETGPDRLAGSVLEAEIARQLQAMLPPPNAPVPPKGLHPWVLLVAGVNGSGKTTTIGKLAAQWQGQGFKVMLAAADTFRAAAAPQLAVWAQRSGATLFEGASADPASVAYQALQAAQAGGFDVLLIDTAGRLPNRPDLLAELQKIPRVLAKLNPAAPHACWLVLDATLGQSTVGQVQAFQAALPLTGLVVTKLDGTARAGFLLPLAKALPTPLSVHAVGVGEGVPDLGPFNPTVLAAAMVGALVQAPTTLPGSEHGG